MRWPCHHHMAMAGPRDRAEIGRRAELLAARSLTQAGWTILKRNVRYGRLEVDLLAREPSGQLVAVEVRRRASLGAASPFDLLGRRKLHVLRRQRAVLPEGSRIDLLLVVGEEGRERLRLVRGIA